MEKFDLYDKDRKFLNKSLERGTKPPENTFRLVVHGVIFNCLGDKMLVQKRVDTKDIFPGKYDISCGGSVQSGETSSQAIEREMFEELGLKYDFSTLRPNITISFSQGYNDFYIIKKDIDLKDLKLQKTEVECAKWATKQEIFDMIDKGEFIPYFKTFISFMFEKTDQLKGIND